jgi:hypothetical protein
MNFRKGFLALSIILGILVICSASYAENQESDFVIGKTIKGSDLFLKVANGRAWGVLPLQAKITFIVGLQEGWLLVLMRMKEVGGQDISALWENARDYAIDLTRSEIAKQVDSFYSDSANVRVPVVEAYRYIHRKVKGASPEELARIAADLRRTYNK